MKVTRCVPVQSAPGSDLALAADNRLALDGQYQYGKRGAGQQLAHDRAVAHFEVASESDRDQIDVTVFADLKGPRSR